MDHLPNASLVSSCAPGVAAAAPATSTTPVLSLPGSDARHWAPPLATPALSHAVSRLAALPIPASATFPTAPNPTSVVVVVPPYHVRVSLHDDLLLQGTFVAFDRVMNPVLRDCIELYPQAGRLATRPFLFPSTTLVSMTIETLYSSPPMIAVSMFTAGSSTPSGGYVGGGPSMALILPHIIVTPFSHRLGC